MVMFNQKRNNTSDFIIVGQGIAGSVLALSLIKAGYSVLIIDQPRLSASSKIAAGIWNPVVFKRLTKSWLADSLIPELVTFYSVWEKELNVKLLYDRRILKPFTEEQEEKLWLKKSSGIEPENEFLDSCIYHDLPLDKYYTVKSYSKVLQAGSLDVVRFLEYSRRYLKDHYDFSEEEFDHSQLKITDNEVSYKTFTANHIVFCEGHLISKNPYFDWIPMKPAKGETLTICSEHLTLEKDIFNKGFFILPLGNKLFKIGATYEWDTLNDIPTEKGQSELIKKLNAVVTTPYKIVRHEAGVRPSVIDRRPVIGKHPEYKNIFLFNGLGTKAVMLAPYFAKQFVACVRNNSKIDEEVNPSRFKA